MRVAENGLGKCAEVVRGASVMAIRRSARRVHSQLEILLRAWWALFCVGEVL